MERLRDQQPGDPELELAKRLVDAKAKAEPDPFLRERVRARLKGRRAQSRWAALARGRQLRPIGVVAVLLVLALFSVASAMVGRAVIRRLRGAAPAVVTTGSVAPLPTVAPEPPLPVPPAPPQAVSPPPVKAVAGSSPSAPHVRRPARPPIEESAPVGKSSAPAPAVGEAAPVAAPPKPSAAPKLAAPSAAESALVGEAFRALRQLHAPDRAIVLVDTYLEQYPAGALVEESLALGLEAARTTDPNKARGYATRYVALFPAGRYEKEAQRILSRPR